MKKTLPLIQTKAKAFGTLNSPTDGQILYIDPNHADERHHSPKLTHAEAVDARERGLIEDFDAKNDKASEEAQRSQVDPNSIGQQAAQRTAEFAKQDASIGAASSTLDSRQSTAFENRDQVQGDVQGRADGMLPPTNLSDIETDIAEQIDEESGDDDAPPPPKKRATKAQTAS